MRHFLALLVFAPAAATAADPNPLPKWDKVVLDRAFRSEGVAVADVNNDGKPDVLTGEYWYQAPDWTPHPMRPAADHKDGLNNYSRVFACWAADFNADGFVDLLVIGFPGEPCHWMENPGNNPAPPTGWVMHQVWHSACNETPVFTDLLGDGKKVLVMATQPKGAKPDANQGQMAYFTPAADPTAEWVMHPVSAPSEPGKPVPGTFRYAHGLGVGDLNGDGKLDVICTGGWWQQPPKPDGPTPWAFHPADLGPDAADLFAADVDGDGAADVIGSSAHKFGLFVHKQRSTKDKPDAPAFARTDLFPALVSETHALHYTDIDGDGEKDLVTGKRWWSHGKSEPGSSWPARLFWFKGVREPDGRLSFTPHLIDADSGIGTQFTIADMDGDGRPDVVTSNKRGVRVLFQRRAEVKVRSAELKK